jgi:hypothetical protein
MSHEYLVFYRIPSKQACVLKLFRLLMGQSISGTGLVKCSSSITLSSVLYVPSFPVNLLPVSSFVDQLNCIVLFDKNMSFRKGKYEGRLGLKSDMMIYGIWTKMLLYFLLL